VESNGRVAEEYNRLGRGLEGSGLDSLEVLSRYLPGFEVLKKTIRATHISLGRTVLEGVCQSELPYDWRFIVHQFVLATSTLRLMTSNFFQLNTCFLSPYATSSLTRG
jgi:hypothetical protein